PAGNTPSLLSRLKPHRSVAPDQHLLEGLRDEALLLSHAFQVAEDGNTVGPFGGNHGDFSCYLGAALLAMVLDSRKAVIGLEGLLFLDDSGRAGASQRHLRGNSGSETNS